ncbi:SDR family NAD(P)-dependent oxidoreductase [Streptomyces sp. NPDC088729]|uniref:SDR family NAD(P)-dependent oxidoreductase n=1 Tax=Streptomyces sp. NPDC088729 TaxID=3365876 RepID=UPI00380F5DBD
MPVALITGGSKGLGRALAEGLAGQGWDLVLGARTAGVLEETAREVRERYGTRVAAVPGDVTEEGCRADLVAATGALGGLDLLVCNAGALGAEPLVRLESLPLEGLRQALETNVVAALGLVQEALGPLRASAAGSVVVVSSQAAVEAYGTWGGYGASKAALDRLAAVLGEEEPGLRVWAVDPGDMATDLYEAAVPQGEEYRPSPRSVVPAFLRLVRERPAGGRFTAAALLEPAGPDRGPFEVRR